MRLFIDLDTRQFLQNPALPRVIPSLAFKRRDIDLLEIQFLRERVVQDLDATVRVGLKPAGNYLSDFFASGTSTQTGSGTAALYPLTLNLNTDELNNAFDAASEPTTLAAMLEVEWSSNSGNVSSSLTLPVTLHNDVIRGDEGTPATNLDLKATQAEALQGTDNEKWMTPLRTREAINSNPPALVKHTFTSANIASPFFVSRSRNQTILRLDTNVPASTGTAKIVLPRYADGAQFGDVIRVRFMRVGQSAPLDVRAHEWNGTAFAANHTTLATQTETNMSFVLDEFGWILEEQWTG